MQARNVQMGFGKVVVDTVANVGKLVLGQRAQIDGIFVGGFVERLLHGLQAGFQIADMGAVAALKADRNLMNGLNIYKGKVTCEGVAQAHNMDYTQPQVLL